jgi:hypothetical protein
MVTSRHSYKHCDVTLFIHFSSRFIHRRVKLLYIVT